MQLSLGCLLAVYALGVLTVPALVAVGVYVFWLNAPDADGAPKDDRARGAPLAASAGQQSAAPRGSRALALPYSGRRTGWLHITRSLGKPPETFDAQVKLADMVARGITNWIQGKRPDSKAADSAQDVYYVVLDGDTLVMYDGEAMGECRGVIIMSKHRVSLHHHANVTESQVYSRRTPIKLSPVGAAERDLCRGQVAEYYIYADRPTDKEDWYFALLWSSLEFGALEGSDGEGRSGTHATSDRLGADHASTGAGSESTQQSTRRTQAGGSALRVSIKEREQMRLRMRRSCMVPDSTGIDAVLQTVARRGTSPDAGMVCEDEWLNAIIGRIFLGTYRTEWMRQHFIRKMQTKFDRVQRPAFLDRVVVADLDVGDNVPLVTSPRLESFDANGQVDLSMYMHYMGGFKLVLDTAVKLGSLRLSISLSVVLQNVAGKMLLRFKPAPSNRFWLAFYEMPTIGLTVSPVFMQKQVKYAAVSQAIEKQIYDMVRLSLVLPHMDDTVFFPTIFEDGGILERSLKDFRDAGLDKEESPKGGAPADTTRSGVASAGSTPERARASPQGTSRTGQPDSRPSGQVGARPGGAGVSDKMLAGAAPGRRASRAAASEDGAVPPRDMATPVAISDNSPSSSADSLARFGQEGAAGTIALPRGLSATPSAGPRPASPKPTLSESAASWFKRAKDSQAAGSAKAWWQSLQPSGTSDDGSSPLRQPPTAPTPVTADALPEQESSGASTRRQPAHTPAAGSSAADSPGSAESSGQSLSSPQLRGTSHIGAPPKAVADHEDQDSSQIPPWRLDEGCSSSVFSNQSAAASDSLLLRRRSAAQSQDSGIQMLTKRRAPKPASSQLRSFE
ncbi:hypothetical protein LPJ61_000053 [Coemansia biformis]|uniref:SMP-LTD domain-containing protein n=1 Tax=Coemansia biformis TaxID=1286918 RepID=A0A9W7YJK1_9FUNG|nr:hypothetical protein LPJ61_000053 [Coemansia biformis]